MQTSRPLNRFLISFINYNWHFLSQWFTNCRLKCQIWILKQHQWKKHSPILWYKCTLTGKYLCAYSIFSIGYTLLQPYTKASLIMLMCWKQIPFMYTKYSLHFWSTVQNSMHNFMLISHWESLKDNEIMQIKTSHLYKHNQNDCFIIVLNIYKLHNCLVK